MSRKPRSPNKTLSDADVAQALEQQRNASKAEDDRVHERVRQNIKEHGA